PPERGGKWASACAGGVGKPVERPAERPSRLALCGRHTPPHRRTDARARATAGGRAGVSAGRGGPPATSSERRRAASGPDRIRGRVFGACKAARRERRDRGGRASPFERY